MKKAIIIVIAVLLAQPAFANLPAVDFIAQEKAAGINLIGVGGKDPSDPKFRLDAGSGVTPEQMAQAKQDALAFDWTVKADPPPKAAATTDDTAALQAKLDALEARIAKLEAEK